MKIRKNKIMRITIKMWFNWQFGILCTIGKTFYKCFYISIEIPFITIQIIFKIKKGIISKRSLFSIKGYKIYKKEKMSGIINGKLQE